MTTAFFLSIRSILSSIVFRSAWKRTIRAPTSASDAFVSPLNQPAIFFFFHGCRRPALARPMLSCCCCPVDFSASAPQALWPPQVQIWQRFASLRGASAASIVFPLFFFLFLFLLLLCSDRVGARLYAPQALQQNVEARQSCL